MNSASESRTFEEVAADFGSCGVGGFFNQNFVDSPVGLWDFHRNENQALRFNDVTPVSPVGLTAGLSPPSDFVEHQFALNEIVSSMVNTRLSSYVEAYLTRLQAVYGQLTVDQAILILRRHLLSTNPSPHNPHFGHSASPSMPSDLPVEVAPATPNVVITEPGTSAGTPMEVPAVSDTGDLGAYDISSLRRIFQDGDRVKVECLWSNCGRTMMKDNHPRHIRECHLRTKRVVRKSNIFP